MWGRGCMNIKKASSHVKTEHILNFHSRQHTNCGFKRGRRALSCGKKMRVVFLLRTESDASFYPDDTQAGREGGRETPKVKGKCSILYTALTTGS